MAYNTEDLFNTALKVISEHKPTSINMLVAIMGIGKETFYSHFPTESNQHKEVIITIAKGKGERKAQMLKKWANSTKPGLQIALFRLLADPDELRALSMRTQELEVPEDLEIQININRPKPE